MYPQKLHDVIWGACFETCLIDERLLPRTMPSITVRHAASRASRSCAINLPALKTTLLNVNTNNVVSTLELVSDALPQPVVNVLCDQELACSDISPTPRGLYSRQTSRCLPVSSRQAPPSSSTNLLDVFTRDKHERAVTVRCRG